jgi:hypothetical protein
MIWEHGPGQDRPCAALGQSRNPRDEVGAIGTVPEDDGAFYTLNPRETRLLN